VQQTKKDAAPFRKIFVYVDGGNVQSIHGPKTIEEVVMIDNDNGEADEQTALENEEAQAVLDMHLKAGRIIELY